MIKKSIITGLVFCLFFSYNLSAQKRWSLRDCIEYARQENISVKKSRLSVESREVDVKLSKAALFPDLSGSISQGFSNAKVYEDNKYKYEGIFNGQYRLSSNWTVFDGKKRVNTIKQALLEKEAEELNTLEIQNNIEISITEIYLQLLYARESIKNNENIVEVSEAQLKQTQDFLDAGSITRSEYAQVEAQYSADKYNLVLAQNSYDDYKLQLKQLLELDYHTEFEPEFPQPDNESILLPIPDAYEVYETALSLMPEIKTGQLNLNIADLDISIAKAGYLPSISLTGSLGTSNIYNNSPSFATQIDRNFSQNIGLSISIPLFDNRKNKSNVQKANVQYQIAGLNYADAEKTLLRTVESLHRDAVSAQSKFLAATEKLKSSELSYTLVKEQYSLGMRNTVELTTEQNNYANALQELLQAKYTALLSLKLLNFYRGIEIDL